MTRRVVVHDRRRRQDQHAAVEEMQRVVGMIEEEDVTQAQHHSRHGHRNRRQEPNESAGRPHAARLFEKVRGAEHQRRADRGSQQRHLEAVEIRIDHPAVDQAEDVVAQAERKVVGPELDERGVHGHAENREDEHAHDDAEAEHPQVEATTGLRDVRHATRRELRLLPALHPPVDDECEQHRQQEHQAHDRAPVEILLADHLLEDVDGEHAEIAADHLRNAEVADGVREYDHRRADETVTRSRQRDGEELAQPGRAERLCRFVEAAVGQQQRGQHDHQRMREDRVHRADDDADRPVNRIAEEPALERTLVAEPLDERDRRQHRRRQNRRERDQPEGALPRNAASRQSVGEGERERDCNRGDHQGHPQGVECGVAQRGVLQVLAEQLQPDECSASVFGALDQDHRQRRKQKNGEYRARGEQQPLREAILPMRKRLDTRARKRRKRWGRSRHLRPSPGIREGACSPAEVRSAARLPRRGSSRRCCVATDSRPAAGPRRR